VIFVVKEEDILTVLFVLTEKEVFESANAWNSSMQKSACIQSINTLDETGYSSFMLKTTYLMNPIFLNYHKPHFLTIATYLTRISSPASLILKT